MAPARRLTARNEKFRRSCSMSFRILAHVVAILGLLLFPLPAARAQSGQTAESLERIKELNREALADYQAGDFESAKLSLLEALALGARTGLDSHAMMARTYVHLGAVYVNGYKDRGRGEKALVSALKIQPDIGLTDATATPQLRETLAAAQAETKAATSAGASPAPKAKPIVPPSAAPPPPAAPPVPAVPPLVAAPPPPASAPLEKKPEAPPQKTNSSQGSSAVVAHKAAPASPSESDSADDPDLPASIPQPLFCPNPDEAPPSQQIALRCVIQPDLQVARVVLFYRTPGGERFTIVPTVRSPKGWYSGIIPSEAATGKSLQYYFEARDSSDQVAGSVGRSDSPNLMLIRSGASSVAVGTWGASRLPRTGESQLTQENPLEAIDRENLRQRRSAGTHRRGPGALFVGVGAGSGYGWHPVRTLEFYDDHEIESGLTPSGFMHLMPEIGYQISDRFALSLQGRMQLISQTGAGDSRPGSPATAAVAVLARAQYLVGEGNAQLVLSAFGGGGEGFRLTLGPRPPALRRNDSVRGGPLVVGPGVGFLYHLTSYMALALEARGLVGFPDLAAVGDLGAGLQFSF
jgi:hypothetical protein